MEWGRSYTATWRVFRVNRDTWADAEQVRNVDSVSVSRTANGNLLESGSMEATGELPSDYYRIVLTAEQGGDVARVDVATLLFISKGGKRDYGTTVQSIDGYSVLRPAETTALLAGEYAPAGVDGAAYARDLLASAINAPVVADGSFVLNDHVVHEIGSSVLRAVWNVLDAGNFVMQIDGRGVVHMLPKPTAPALRLNNQNARLMTTGIDYSSDYSDIPNRYIVLVGSNKTIAVNDDINSSVSTVSRGYYVDMVDESPKPVNAETISAYALRKLHEASIVREEHSYIREYAPNVNLYSLVRSSLNGLEGDLRVASQSITCNYGVTVSEKAYKEVALW